MFSLASMLYSLIATTLAGSAIVVSLVLGYDTLVPLLIAAGIGCAAALPASLIVAKQMRG
jgi:hypothetical protein